MNPTAETIEGYPILPQGLAGGWTQGLDFGTPTWLIVDTIIVYGVGIDVLAQPQLAVRFMTVISDRELNRGVMYGGAFLLFMTGVVFVVGALSNVVFFKIPDQVGKVLVR